MEKQKITGSEALLKALIAEGVDTIFGYPGGQAIPIYDSLYDYRDQLRHVLVRHEQGATHAAQGYARVSGKVGVTLVTSGPGATNTITGRNRRSSTLAVVGNRCFSGSRRDWHHATDHEMGLSNPQAGGDRMGCFSCFLYRFYRPSGSSCAGFSEGRASRAGGL